MIKRFFSFTLVCLGLVFLGSCEKEVNNGPSEELLRLNAYIKVLKLENPNLSIDSTESGLYYITEINGDGNYPQKDEYILFNYTAYNLNEDAYETTIEADAKLHSIYSKATRYTPKYIQHKSENTRLPKGLEEGFSLIRKGSKVRFIMPSSLAYGVNNYLSLSAYTSVIFDVDFRDIVSDPVAYELKTITEYVTANYPDITPANVITKLNETGVFILEESRMDVEASGDGSTSEDPYQTINDKDILNVNYAGRFTDSWLFDTNIKSVDEENETYNSSKTYEPIKVTIGGSGFIEGFSIAIKQLKTNTKAKVIIRSKYAYGEIGDGKGIPPYAPLIFDLEVLKKTTSANQ